MSLGIKIPKNALKAGQAEYKKNPKGSGNVDLERGVYVAAVDGLKGVETDNGPRLLLEVLVGGDVDDDVKGGKTAVWWSFEEDRTVWLFRDLAKLGYQVDSLDTETLEEIDKDLRKNHPVVKIKINAKGFANLQGLVEDESAKSIGVSFGKKDKGDKGKKKDKGKDKSKKEGKKKDKKSKKK